jgi:hypothetical protein
MLSVVVTCQLVAQGSSSAPRQRGLSGRVDVRRQRRPAQGRRPCHPQRDGWAKLGHDDGAGDEQVWRQNPYNPYAASRSISVMTSSLHRFASFRETCVAFRQHLLEK